jgi:uncharacterized protein (TIGR02145 family)
MELTFSAENNGASVPLDSIKVMNRTQGGETMIYWPDHSLSLEIEPRDLLLFVGYATLSGLGIQEIKKEKGDFQLFQSYPNPTKGHSLVSMMVPEEGTVRIVATDMQGREVIAYERYLERGCHSFCFTPGDGDLYLLSASYKGTTQSIKIVNAEPAKGINSRLEYIGSVECEPKTRLKSLQTGAVKQSGILASPSSDNEYHFQFATKIPCPGTPTVEYVGQVYNTIQVFSQCWLKENLNVGTMIEGTIEQSNNGTIEKYCYNNEPDSCTKYGGLYLWDEMMQYTTQQGAKGICPTGWHLPTDEEWKVLEGAVDSQYGIGDSTWDDWGWRGTDAGTKLKTTSCWNANGNGTDLFGFSGLPGGNRLSGGGFYYIGITGYWWTSTESNDYSAWGRYLGSGPPGVARGNDNKGSGFSVRCLRDY